jgi:hypothetical protein
MSGWSVELEYRRLGMTVEAVLDGVWSLRAKASVVAYPPWGPTFELVPKKWVVVESPVRIVASRVQNSEVESEPVVHNWGTCQSFRLFHQTLLISDHTGHTEIG